MAQILHKRCENNDHILYFTESENRMLLYGKVTKLKERHLKTQKFFLLKKGQ